ncbi:unnamed protein product [Vitrella brassicaformis CCMP3155]|uniref:PDZ domain-containing protein n=1 Tax=Vitrella brassicaformis (strain CCMP3155) TaxID=1169540 RepID=A0A0G4EYN7_VITBC|nr:unnamed protein product [Vitrella brassicaformis CCMP3155]|eukprot:CEM04173.1 unnamed protein product [Vitrella brassicaformis CCMP3155]
MVPEGLQQLIKDRDAMESEMEALTAYLTAPGMPGVRGNLLDAEGFPRADLDIVPIRQARHKLACLQTDHAELMKKIEAGLHDLHAQGAVRVPRGPGSSSSSSGPSSRANGVGHRPAFAVVDEVSAGSPSEAAGLQINDRIVAFGDVDASTPDGFKSIARVVQENVGRNVNVVVRREAREMALSLRPQTWSGRGLLGCHLQPMK